MRLERPDNQMQRRILDWILDLKKKKSPEEYHWDYLEIWI